MSFSQKGEIKFSVPHAKMLEKMFKVEPCRRCHIAIGPKERPEQTNYYHVVENSTGKLVVGEDYNYTFDKLTGNFMRWGKTFGDDPKYSPIGPEILDIEITTSCNGINGKLCPFCYKSNTPNGKNMSFDTFKHILDSFPKTLTQIAFGADSEASSNPDLWKMADYARSKGVIPNITVANIDDETADKLVNVMGAVAVSRYSDKNVCYNSVSRLTSRNLKQVNIHFMISEETYDNCMETLKDIKTDYRLAGLNAIVLLSLKKKGRGTKFTPLAQSKYDGIVNYCLENNIRFGMDSCGAKKFIDAVQNHPRIKDFLTVCEPCESTLFSSYIDVDGFFSPCSFCGGCGDWVEGIDTKKSSDFLIDVWYNDRVIKFRNMLCANINNKFGLRECPVFEV